MFFAQSVCFVLQAASYFTDSMLHPRTFCPVKELSSLLHTHGGYQLATVSIYYVLPRFEIQITCCSTNQWELGCA
jgi:hypothetical protein